MPHPDRPDLVPGKGKLVRVTYKLFAGDATATFDGTIVTELPPGQGPNPDKPGKRFMVKAHEAVGLDGWYSVRDFAVLGWDVNRLPAAEFLMLEALRAWSAIGHRQRPFPTSTRRYARALEVRGLVRIGGKFAGKVLVSLTDVGRATAYDDGLPARRTKSAR